MAARYTVGIGSSQHRIWLRRPARIRKLDRLVATELNHPKQKLPASMILAPMRLIRKGVPEFRGSGLEHLRPGTHPAPASPAPILPVSSDMDDREHKSEDLAQSETRSSVITTWRSGCDLTAIGGDGPPRR
jgi:hypothetical protein